MSHKKRKRTRGKQREYPVRTLQEGFPLEIKDKGLRRNQKPNLPTHLSWTCSFWNSEKIYFSPLSHPVWYFGMAVLAKKYNSFENIRWIYFWALCSVPLVYVRVLMPVPGCFDYSGLVIQFDIRYCDPSCFVLLSQNCCSYSGSVMVPYKFLKCFFYICEICRRYFNRDCIESINRFG